MIQLDGTSKNSSFSLHPMTFKSTWKHSDTVCSEIHLNGQIAKWRNAIGQLPYRFFPLHERSQKSPQADFATINISIKATNLKKLIGQIYSLFDRWWRMKSSETSPGRTPLEGDNVMPCVDKAALCVLTMSHRRSSNNLLVILSIRNTDDSGWYDKVRTVSDPWKPDL